MRLGVRVGPVGGLAVGTYPLYKNTRLGHTVAYASFCTSNRRFSLCAYRSYKFAFARKIPMRTRVNECCRAPSCVSRSSAGGNTVGTVCRRMHRCVLKEGTHLIVGRSRQGAKEVLSVNANANCFTRAVRGEK